MEQLKQFIEKAHMAVKTYMPRTSISRANISKPVLIISAAILIFIFLVLTKPTALFYERPEKSWAVNVEKITSQKKPAIISAFGEVLAARATDLRSLVAGEVVEVSGKFRNGEKVEKGEFLLQIDPFIYENNHAQSLSALKAGKANLREHQANLAQAKRNLNRAKQLFLKGNVAQQYLDERQTDFAIKQEKVLEQNANIEKLEATVLRAKRDLEDTRLTSPFDAYISEVNVREGKLVSTNDKVAYLTDAKDFEIKFHLPDSVYGNFLKARLSLVGQPILATWIVGTQKLKLKAKISRLSASIDSQMRGVDVFAKIDDTRLYPLRVGAFVEVALNIDLPKKSFLIARDSLFQADEGDIVYLIKDSRLLPKKVQVLMLIGEEALITKGLKEGDYILTTRFQEASKNLLVSPFIEGVPLEHKQKGKQKRKQAQERRTSSKKE